MTDFDFDAALEDVETDESDIEKLRKVVDEANAIRREIEEAEEFAKTKKEAYRKLTEEKLPDMFLALGIDELKTSDGASVSVEDYIAAKLPKNDLEKRMQVLDWVSENGGEGLIKAKVELAFAKEELEKAKELAQRLEMDGYSTSTNLDIHHSTLRAFFNDMLKAGDEIPELPGVFTGRRAKIVEAKK